MAFNARNAKRMDGYTISIAAAYYESLWLQLLQPNWIVKTQASLRDDKQIRENRPEINLLEKKQKNGRKISFIGHAWRTRNRFSFALPFNLNWRMPPMQQQRQPAIWTPAAPVVAATETLICGNSNGNDKRIRIDKSASWTNVQQ